MTSFGYFISLSLSIITFIEYFSNYLLNVYCVLDTAQGTKDNWGVGQISFTRISSPFYLTSVALEVQSFLISCL